MGGSKASSVWFQRFAEVGTMVPFFSSKGPSRAYFVALP